ncbi:MAG: transglycosylase domain-containing protein [Deltaproteobacteria bacterium]|nr:transglycosylase domain-containing protein [Deltaproteobacteria bacterium]
MDHNYSGGLPPLPEFKTVGGRGGQGQRGMRLLPERLSFSLFVRNGLLLLTLLLMSLSGLVCLYLSELGLLSPDAGRLAFMLAWKPEDNSLIFDREQRKIAELYHRDHTFVPYRELPEALVQAIIATEDQHFFEHAGVDPEGILRALFVWLSSGFREYRQGGSTITQQLVRHFFLPGEKTVSRKLREMVLALRLEQLISKEKILEIYTNALFLGGGAYGVGAAARRFFSRPVSELKTHELAMIAGLFQSPGRYNPHKFPGRAKRRQEQVLRAMRERGYLSPADFRYWSRQKLPITAYRSLWGKKAPYFVDYVTQELSHLLGDVSVRGGGLRVYTSLDSVIQSRAEEVLHNKNDLLRQAEEKTRRWQPAGQPPVELESAILVTSPASGDIVAMVGGRDYAKSSFNRCSQALRQPGSAFKPVLYSLALLRGMRWSDSFYVSPLTLPGNYRPRSPARDYMTRTTLMRAFYRSMNAPVMELGQRLGLDAVLEHARHLGIHSPVRREFGSLLGASELTMTDLARVNGVFAAQGTLTDLSAVIRVTDRDGVLLYERKALAERSRQVLDPRVAWLMLHGMKQVLYRGTGRAYSHLAPVAAGKTGTSNESKDNWFTGFSADYVAVVWVGADHPQPLHPSLHGSRLALPLWGELMEGIYKDRQPGSFVRPGGIRPMQVNPFSGRLDPHGVRMWFLDHTQPHKREDAPGNLSNLESFRNPF